MAALVAAVLFGVWSQLDARAPIGAPTGVVEDPPEEPEGTRDPAEALSKEVARLIVADKHDTGVGSVQTAERATSRALLVRNEAGQPVPRATVVWADQAAMERLQVAMQQARESGKSLVEPATMVGRIKAMGTATVTDENGRVAIPAIGEFLLAYCESNELEGIGRFRLHESSSPLELVVKSGGVLRVRVQDRSGIPIAGLPMVALWRVAEGLDYVGQKKQQLGLTDPGGRLKYRGWRFLANDANSLLKLGGCDVFVGPAIPGVPPADYLLMGRHCGDEAVVVMSRPIEASCELLTANGDPFELSGTRVLLRGVVGPYLAIDSVEAGRSRHLIGSSGQYQWRAIAGRLDCGSGHVELGNAALHRLLCQNVATVKGTFGWAVAAAEVRFESEDRGQTTLHLETDDDGRFQFALGRHEGVRMLSFIAAERRSLVTAPPQLGAVWDVGYLGGQQIAFGSVSFRAKNGPYARSVPLVAAKPGGGRVDLAVEVADNGKHVLHTNERCDALVVTGAANGFEEFVVTVERGRDVLIPLQALLDAKLTVGLPALVDRETLRVGLRGRWDELANEWRPLFVNEELAVSHEKLSAGFGQIGEGRYRASVWSMQPVCELASDDVYFEASSPAPVLNVVAARTVVADVAAGPDGYWLVCGSNLLDVNDNLNVTHIPNGRSRWTVRADEREVVLLAQGKLPRRVSVSGGMVSAALLPISGGDLGLGPKAKAIRPRSVSLPPRRPVHVYSMTSGELSRQILPMSEWCAGFPLPCDYDCSVGSTKKIARWTGSGWR